MRVIILIACGVAIAAAQDKSEFFEQRVRPVLSRNCYACHTQSKLGGLELDSREHLLKGGKSGPAIVPGKPDASLLIQAVKRTHETLKMPPEGPLPAADIDALTAWVKMGAVWPESSVARVAPKAGEYVITPEQRSFWSFRPVAKPEVPRLNDTNWAKSAIDSFVLAKLSENGLKPVRAAEKRVLIRRATFDLIGLPPSPAEIDAFVADSSSEAFGKVIDRLLASPHYGERWARYWLDFARYADGALGADKDTPFSNAYRYRDWVIDAFNSDMPYDVFVKAQLAADLLPESQREKLLPGLGFHALGGDADERVDVTTRAFLGLTVGCAQCHDHKYDPIPTKDYYSLLGVFKSSENYQYPLVAEDRVTAYKKHKDRIEEKTFELNEFVLKQSTELGEFLAAKTARYLLASWKVITGVAPSEQSAAEADQLDEQILSRWVAYLKSKKDHPYLKPFEDLLTRESTEEAAEKVARDLQTGVLAMFREKHEKDDRNYVALGGTKGKRDEKTRQYTNLESLEIVRYYYWRDLASEPYKKDFIDFKGGVYYFGEKNVARFLAPEWKDHFDKLRGDLAQLKKSLPKEYPFLHTVRDGNKPADTRVAIRGDAMNLGDIAPRRAPAILCKSEPAVFSKGSGRLQLAEFIASPANPLTARVMANRVWQFHFGQGIVRTPSNFGQLGDRPTHPELLDYLAARLVEGGWSIKTLHREIMLSAAYQLSADHSDANYEKDPENKMLWRANLRTRLEAEVLRDSLLAVAGNLDEKAGGPPKALTNANRQRTIYGYVGRTQPDVSLALFDFPNPNNMSEQRVITLGPMQRLYFLNNSFVEAQAAALAERLKTSAQTDGDRIRLAYRLLFGRLPTREETQLGMEFLSRSGESWPQYAQVLFGSSEFSSVN
ncbi:MAG: PSD1 and planctomycete cytochrome C domain-containing protein [Bryobacteraceae bacterium]